MDRNTAITDLPTSYAAALVLHQQDRDDEIPEQLGIAPEAVPAMLRLAEAKLNRLLAGQP
jgi:hypothetical protein